MLGAFTGELRPDIKIGTGYMAGFFIDELVDELASFAIINLMIKFISTAATSTTRTSAGVF